jgi:hypothetical protein
MKRLLAVILAGTFALITTAPAVAAEKTDPAIAKACKGKKAGTEVMVGGKKVKCPAATK